MVSRFPIGVFELGWRVLRLDDGQSVPIWAGAANPTVNRKICLKLKRARRKPGGM
jgi:hypothetical protein